MAQQEFLARAGYNGPAHVDADGNSIQVTKGDTLKVEFDHTLVQARVLYNPKHESQAGVLNAAGVAARKKRQKDIMDSRAKDETAAG